MAITNLDRYLEGLIGMLADERGVDSYFNEDWLRTQINERTKEEAWVSLSAPERIWKILEVCKKMSRKGILTPQKRRQNSVFYAKAPLKLRTLKQNQ